jgi:cell division protease FtsH
MCEALMTYETISSDQIDQLMARQEVTPPEGWNDSQERVDAVKEEEAANSSESVAESDVPEVDQDDQASQSNEGQSGWGDPQDDQKDEPKQ